MTIDSIITHYFTNDYGCNGSVWIGFQAKNIRTDETFIGLDWSVFTVF